MGKARQTELRRWAYRCCRDGPEHRCRAKPTHARNPKERQPARGSRGNEGGRGWGIEVPDKQVISIDNSCKEIS